jgi:hypothetical protein
MASKLELQAGDSRSMTYSRHSAPLYAWVVLIICAAVFVIRGPIRAADPAVNMDTPLLLAAAATWRHGGNPYDPASVASTFGTSASLISATLRRGQQAFVYSPPVYALLSPITYLPWSTQRVVWNLLNVAMFLTALVLTCVLFEVPIVSVGGLSIVGVGLATNPGHICIALGQTGVAMLLLMMASWCLVPGGSGHAARSKVFFSALAMGVAAILKPQIAIVFMVLDFYAGRVYVAAYAMAIAAVLFIAALAIHGDAVVLVQSWIDNMHALMHAEADPLYGSLPHQLINLQSPLAVLTGSRMLSSVLAIATCALMGLTYVWIDRHTSSPAVGSRARWLNMLSAATILMLLIFYHRTYDAVFLMIPGAFAIRQISLSDRRGWTLLAVLAPNWIPLSSMVHRGLDLPGGFAVSTIVQALLVQHQTWFLLAAFLILCEVRRRNVVANSHGEATQVASLPA